MVVALTGTHMKIDIGMEGKILGTKRVSPNGQVSGLSEYAGEEVLIVYPGPRERYKTNSKEPSDNIRASAPNTQAKPKPPEPTSKTRLQRASKV
jgi:hypothetical protein